MDGFVDLIKDLLIEDGIESPSIYCREKLQLPGYYRPEKKWDLLVIADGCLLATVEFKSQVGPSYGNNYNNRTEEAIGSAQYLWTAYREGAFEPSSRPWVGCLMLLEEEEKSTKPVGVREPHFRIFDDFRDASYAKRYEVLLTRLVRERLYDGACFLLSERRKGRKGSFREPAPELTFQNFASSLLGRAIAHVKTHRS